jgi:hypothetical protein
MSVDFGLFGENNVKDIPYETRPIYDPLGIMTNELASRDFNDILSQTLRHNLDSCQDLLNRAEEALEVDPRFTLVLLHLYAWDLAEVLTVGAGDNRTTKRKCSRLERAVRRRDREDLVKRCGQLYGFPETLRHAGELLSQLQEGYRGIWSFFRGKDIGPPYMIQQPDSELWFRNRMEPVYRNDPRDLVWIVYIEFPFVTRFLFLNLTDHQTLPSSMFQEPETSPEAPRSWVSRHLRCLGLFDAGSSEEMLLESKDLIADAREFVDRRLYVR